MSKVKRKRDISWAVSACEAGLAVTRPSWDGAYVKLRTQPAFFAYEDVSGNRHQWFPTGDDLLAIDYTWIPYSVSSSVFKGEYERVPCLSFDAELEAIQDTLSNYTWCPRMSAGLIKDCVARIRSKNLNDPVAEYVRIGILPYNVAVGREEFNKAKPELRKVAEHIFMCCSVYMPEEAPEPCQG